MSRRTKIDLVLLAIVLSFGVFAALNAVALADIVHRVVYRPSPELKSIVAAAGMSPEGERLFYRFSPEVLDKTALYEQCGPRLGCVEGRKIYLLRWQTSDEQNTAVVTASHEMLHVAYSRLSKDQKQEIDALVRTTMQQPENTRIASKLIFYKKRPETYVNEAHSYAGTEIATLSPKLEEHYRRYFADRKKVTSAYFNSPEGR